MHDYMTSDIVVCVRKLTGRGLHTWHGLIGYIHKDEGLPHFRYASRPEYSPYICTRNLVAVCAYPWCSCTSMAGPGRKYMRNVATEA